MHIDIAALVSFLPQFVIGGVVSIYFYSTLRNTRFRETPDVTTKMYLDEVSTAETEESVMSSETQTTALDRIMEEYAESQSSAVDKSEEEHAVDEVPHSKYHSTFNKTPYISYGVLGDTQLILLSLDLWILISLLLSPVKRLSALLPAFPSGFSYLIYAILGAIIAISVLSTVVSRIKISKRILPFMIIGAGALAFATFYAPSMVWINGVNGIIKIVILYSAVVLVCMSVYAVATFLKRSSAFSTSAYASFASYGVTAFILFFNLFSLVSK